jgi:4-hydroxy-tetrahydrodipicolinate reductase
MQIALIGYGKMGKAIEEIALDKGHEIVVRIHIDNLEEFTEENVKKADVAIEFTHPGSAFENVTKCLQWRVPVVCGTTGWLDKYEDAKNTCERAGSALLVASNFSIGVNIFFEVNKQLAQLMSAQKDYEVMMEEIHHTEKKDAPSGTAITLAEQILDRIARKKKWVNRLSDNKDELEIISERIDPAPGTHKVKYYSPIDEIEIIHTAHSRKGFAAGALLAAEFIHDKKGVFQMKDVLGF